MAKLEKFTIEPMSLNDDRLEIASWAHRYSDEPGFQGIQKFILENKKYHGLDEVIWNNLMLYPISDDERKYTYVAKIKDGTIIGFVMLDEFDINTTEPELIIQYICLHPHYQHQGYGEAILQEILFHTKKYMPVKPSNTFAYVHKDNIASLALFKKFNFDIGTLLTNSDYHKVQTQEPKLIPSQEACEATK